MVSVFLIREVHKTDIAMVGAISLLAHVVGTFVFVTAVEGFFPQGGGSGDCRLPCAGGTHPSFKDSAVSPLHNNAAPALAFTANGCGTEAVRVSTPDALVPCCSVHDACYSICGVDRAFCDKEFGACLERRCKLMEDDATRQQCMQSQQMLTMGVSMFGCSAFTDAQREMCSCQSEASRKEKIRSLVVNRLYRHPRMTEASKPDDEVEQIAKRVSEAKHPALLIHHILEKYNRSLIELTAAARPSSHSALDDL